MSLPLPCGSPCSNIDSLHLRLAERLSTPAFQYPPPNTWYSTVNVGLEHMLSVVPCIQHRNKGNNQSSLHGGMPRSMLVYATAACVALVSALPFDPPAIPSSYFDLLRPHAFTKRQQVDSATFGDEYTSHASSANLVWFPCYGANNYQCAR
jgi:hypothetical protein